MTSWLTSGNRKRHQRRMNKIMRSINTQIQEDNLWKGRFIVRQVSTQWQPYEDGSGNELWVVLRFIDRLTGKYVDALETVNHWCMWNGSHAFWKMNEVITSTWPVWETDPKPYTAEYKAMTNKYQKEGWPYYD